MIHTFKFFTWRFELMLFTCPIRSLLESSLIQSRLLLAHLDKAGIQVHWHGRETGEPAPCCTNCLDEVFNILFVLNHRGEYLVYCHKCATAMKKSFTVLQQVHKVVCSNTSIFIVNPSLSLVKSSHAACSGCICG